MFTESEKKILRKIRKWLNKTGYPYNFWFTYGINNEAINWEGGFGCFSDTQFRNQYTIREPGKHVIKNW